MSMTTLLDGELLDRLGRRPGCCALIPIKRRALCKSRLAPQLPADARLALVRSMLEQVIAAALAAPAVRQVIVVSPERDTVAAGVPVLADAGAGLNEALLHAHRTLLEFGCREVLVLPADLPFIRPADIDSMVAAGRSSGFAIAPDAAQLGTNALYLAGPEPFRFQFGAGSLQAHLREAQRLGRMPQVLQIAGMAFDVDAPADLSRLEAPWHARLLA